MSGGGPWTLPTPSAGTSGLSTRDRATQRDKLWGRDIWFDVRAGEGADYEVTAAGDWQVAEGREALRQAILRRIITDPGEWATLPDYGVGARAYVKARNTKAARDELTQRIRAQLLRDRRIESVQSVAVESSGGLLRIAVEVIPRGRDLRSDVLRAAVEIG